MLRRRLTRSMNCQRPIRRRRAQAVSREEEAILGARLEANSRETYREPLILFYREQQSVERVAAELELSEDAVKQRLSRGRKLLHEEVISFVEGTLSRPTGQRIFGCKLCWRRCRWQPASAATATASAAPCKRLSRRQVRAFAMWLLTVGGPVGIKPPTGCVIRSGFQPIANAAPKNARSPRCGLLCWSGPCSAKSPWETWPTGP